MTDNFYKGSNEGENFRDTQRPEENKWNWPGNMEDISSHSGTFTLGDDSEKRSGNSKLQPPVQPREPQPEMPKEQPLFTPEQPPKKTEVKRDYIDDALSQILVRPVDESLFEEAAQKEMEHELPDDIDYGDQEDSEEPEHTVRHGRVEPGHVSHKEAKPPRTTPPLQPRNTAHSDNTPERKQSEIPVNMYGRPYGETHSSMNDSVHSGTNSGVYDGTGSRNSDRYKDTNEINNLRNSVQDRANSQTPYENIPQYLRTPTVKPQVPPQTPPIPRAEDRAVSPPVKPEIQTGYPNYSRNENQENIYDSSPVAGTANADSLQSGPSQSLPKYGAGVNPVNTGAVPPGQMPPYAPQYPQQDGIPPFYTSPGGMPPAKPPRNSKKMAMPMKIFLFVVSFLVVGTFVGFTAYAVRTVVDNKAGFNTFGGNKSGEYDPFGDKKPKEKEEDKEAKPESSQPDMHGDVNPPNPDEKKPEIEIVPNPDGIQIMKKPKTQELDAKEVYNKVAVSTVTVVSSMKDENGVEYPSTGTGIIATSDGYIITNSHVVFNSKSTTVKILTLDEKEYDAVVVGVDRTTDLAVLKTNDHKFTPAEFGDANELSIGEWVIAIGNPGGEKFSASLTRGVVSGLNRTVGEYSENGMTFVQTDAAINPGNSGGPLLNMHGQVVGINSSKIITAGYEGMGFAIPITEAKEIINELSSVGYVKGRTRLGIRGSDVSNEQYAMYNLPYGFIIKEIDDDGAFAGTEAKVNDIVIGIDGETVWGLESISNLLLGHKPGDEITVKLYRAPATAVGKSEELEVKIKLLEDKGETQN